ncbi:MAG TPA: ABC transporter ATP-binding protein [Fimbriimonadaceae bacterium]|nr:ABC transporter ATP-binding protein [Fimbriimonadaceae bacterium]
MSDVLLGVRDAVVEFPVRHGVVRALDGVSIEVRRGETVAVVGESGCGKTTLARCVLGLQRLSGGTIELLGKTVKGAEAGQAARVGMVWQDPFASLDPKWRVQRAVEEPLRLAGKSDSGVTLLEQVGLDGRFATRFPHELSGGQRQRVAIARALALKPPLVICDEPTAALDLSIQAQVLNLLKDLQASLGVSYLYISHDLLTVRFLADRIAVMYLGRIVEEGPTEAVFRHPQHPYTRALLESAPSIETLGRLPEPAEGELPDPRERFTGCRFAGRCPIASELCGKEDPGPRESLGIRVWCHTPLGNLLSGDQVGEGGGTVPPDGRKVTVDDGFGEPPGRRSGPPGDRA